MSEGWPADRPMLPPLRFWPTIGPCQPKSFALYSPEPVWITVFARSNNLALIATSTLLTNIKAALRPASGRCPADRQCRRRVRCSVSSRGRHAAGRRPAAGPHRAGPHGDAADLAPARRRIVIGPNPSGASPAPLGARRRPARGLRSAVRTLTRLLADCLSTGWMGRRRPRPGGRVRRAGVDRARCDRRRFDPLAGR